MTNAALILRSLQRLDDARSRKAWYRWAEPFQDTAHLRHLLRVAPGARPAPQRILEPDPDMPPIAAACGAIGIWCRPAPSTDQR